MLTHNAHRSGSSADRGSLLLKIVNEILANEHCRCNTSSTDICDQFSQSTKKIHRHIVLIFILFQKCTKMVGNSRYATPGSSAYIQIWDNNQKCILCIQHTANYFFKNRTFCLFWSRWNQPRNHTRISLFIV